MAFSADEMRLFRLLVLRQAEFLFAECYALHEEGHVPRQLTHGPESLGVLLRLAGKPPVHRIPVVARGHGHSGYGEVLVQLVESGRQPAAASDGGAGADFPGLVEGRAVKQPVEERHERAVGRGVVHGARDDEPVAHGELGRSLVHGVVEHAPAVFRTGAAGYAAADGAAAYMHRLGLHGLGPEYALHLTQCYGGVAVFMRASVDHKDFHCSPHLFVQDMPRPYGTGRMCILYIRGRFFATCTNEA